MPVDRGFVNNTFDGIWNATAKWDSGTTAWPADPNWDTPSLVGHWDADEWDAPVMEWGPLTFAGTTTRYDQYNGEAYWDGPGYWETDFWLTWD